MKKIKLSLLMFVLAFMSANISAQTEKAADWCFSDQHAQEMKDKNPALIQVEQDFRQQVRNYVDNNTPSSSTNKQVTYVIPVVFHVVTDNGSGNVTKADIDAVMVTMNEDFQRTNGDASQTRALFAPYAASMNIEFRLAHLDPNGNCTEGIVRVDSPLSTDATDAVKGVSYWDSKKYFNIWTVKSIDGGSGNGIIAGYAQFPWSGINSTYGIVVDYRFVKGGERTLTHELGHCFGILHTFQGGCASNCSNSGDWICDTPPVSTSSFGCPTTNNTCSNDANGPDPYNANVVDQIENYMSYNSCQNMWSLEQKSSMESVWNSTSTSQGLAQLMTSTNLANTGTADPYTFTVTCKPNADFTYNKEFICEGGSVTYTDQSWGSAATAWNWSFSGGTPNTGSTSNPTITYNSAGVYSTTLTASNSAPGTGSKTLSNIITVSSLTADYTGPIIDGFESTTQFNNDWWILNPTGGQAWQNNNAAAATGSRSVRLRNFITGTTGLIDELISPSFDISALTSPTMTFKVAFKRKSSANNDRLFVYYSTNCGESWVLKTPLVASSMSTAPDQGSIFTPSSASHWLQKSVDISAIAGATNVRFKFTFTSGGGNDVYIDDINIDGATSISEFNNIGNFNVYPNPTSSSAQISFNLIKNVDVLSIKVRNAVGQEVTSVINGQSFSTGAYTLKIDEERILSKGIYFVEFTADGVVKVQKLIVQ